VKKCQRGYRRQNRTPSSAEPRAPASDLIKGGVRISCVLGKVQLFVYMGHFCPPLEAGLYQPPACGRDTGALPIFTHYSRSKSAAPNTIHSFRFVRDHSIAPLLGDRKHCDLPHNKRDLCGTRTALEYRQCKTIQVSGLKCLKAVVDPVLQRGGRQFSFGGHALTDSGDSSTTQGNSQ
jgi:hypothetical protein